MDGDRQSFGFLICGVARVPIKGSNRRCLVYFDQAVINPRAEDVTDTLRLHHTSGARTWKVSVIGAFCVHDRRHCDSYVGRCPLSAKGAR